LPQQSTEYEHETATAVVMSTELKHEEEQLLAMKRSHHSAKSAHANAIATGFADIASYFKPKRPRADQVQQEEEEK
jgi:hypothetical protein